VLLLPLSPQTESFSETLGLSTERIILSVAGAFLLIILLISFILISLKVWSNDSSFDSVIQSMLVAGAGLAQRQVHGGGAENINEADAEETIQKELGLLQQSGKTGGEEEETAEAEKEKTA